MHYSGWYSEIQYVDVSLWSGYQSHGFDPLLNANGKGQRWECVDTYQVVAGNIPWVVFFEHLKTQNESPLAILGHQLFKMHALENYSKFKLIAEKACITSFYCMSIRMSFFFCNYRFGREGIYVTQNYCNDIFYSN